MKTFEISKETENQAEKDGVKMYNFYMKMYNNYNENDLNNLFDKVYKRRESYARRLNNNVFTTQYTYNVCYSVYVRVTYKLRAIENLLNN